MTFLKQLKVWIACGICLFSAAHLHAQAANESPLVFVEGYDAEGELLRMSLGVIVKKGFVATNYHAVAGMHSVGVFTQTSPKKIVSEGYLSVAEGKDLIIISTPGLEGPIAPLSLAPFPEDGMEVTIYTNPSNRFPKTAAARVSGNKDILDEYLPQLVSRETEDCTSGPIMRNGKVEGFVVAGYLDDRYYSYAMPVAQLRRLMNRSFIIKDYNSLSDQKVLRSSYFQQALMENLTAVLWLPLPDAERIARKKGKMVIIDVYTEWSGWSKLMEKNTYTRKRIIRYINENFCAVRFNAESTNAVPFNNLTYMGDSEGRYHTLAYSLLEGNMDFPSTVFLDEELEVLLVVPGYMDTNRMEVVLHYFSEKAYLKEGLSFADYQREFFSRNNSNR